MADERGLKPLVDLWLAPRWANESSDERIPPTSVKGLTGLADVAERYRGVVDACEVWNEPNDERFIRGADPVQDARLLEAASAGFKEGDPDSTVAFGGVSYVDDEWVGRALAAGATGHHDVMRATYPIVTGVSW